VDAARAAQLVGGAWAEPLEGGLLNRVWRVMTEHGAVVVKHAPPYVASNPAIPLDPARIDFEARALSLFQGELAHLSSERIRPPRLLARFVAESAIALEDLGDWPSLEDWLLAGGGAWPLAALGGFIGRLHSASGRSLIALDNQGVQQTRHAVQYAPAAGFLAAGGVPDAAALGARADAFGRSLMRSGRCLVMGDLWPRSVMVLAGDSAYGGADDGAVRLFDWEFCHWGRPGQDLGHLAAHLWMLGHRRGLSGDWAVFLAAYAAERALTAEDREESALHFGCEILARTVGAFQAGYLYDGLPPDAPALREAVSVAAAALRDPLGAPLFTTRSPSCR